MHFESHNTWLFIVPTSFVYGYEIIEYDIDNNNYYDSIAMPHTGIELLTPDGSNIVRPCAVIDPITNLLFMSTSNIENSCIIFKLQTPH